MANILIAWQDDVPDGLPRIAATVARGVATVSTARIRQCPLEYADSERLRWCHAFVIGVQSDPRRVAHTLDRWRRRLEPDLWDSVQGKFALVFAAAPGEAEKRARALECAERMLAAHGMLVTGFSGETASDPEGVEPLGGHFHSPYERMGRLLGGMVHAWVHRAGKPDRMRVLGALVRATRRVPAMRPRCAGADRVLAYRDRSGTAEGTAPNA